MDFNIIAAIVIGYLLGSIPFAYITARLKMGMDIRQVGSGNVGALAIYREVGPPFGLTVLAADVGKGVLTIYVARWLGLDLVWICAAGFAAVVGHNWPVFLKFRGGKGAATVLGVLVALTPVELLISSAIVLTLIAITRNVRLALFALILVPILQWIFDRDFTYIACALGLLLFIGLRTLIGLKGEMARAGVKKNLIIDREHTPWQTRKSG